MRITYITAGAGASYCGSCIRDNALAAALMSAGHEVLLLPIYTPLLTDEKNVTANRVFYNGVSAYLEQNVSLFRHTPWMVDRLWEAPWLLRMAVNRAVQTDPEELQEMLISVLEGRNGYQAKEIDKLVHWLQGQPRPDVVDISNSMLIALAKPLREELGVPVCCTLQGEDVFLSHLKEPLLGRARRLISASADYVDRFLAVSDYCAERMSRFMGIPGAKIDVVPLGIQLAGYEPRAAASSNGFTVGHFGRIAPEKGLHLLCEAYHRLRQTGQLDGGTIQVAGDLSPAHAKYMDSIMDQAREWGIDGEVSYHGKLDRAGKIDFLRRLDVMAVPATYDDPKGLPLLEAMACGVPTIAPRRGTYTEFVERTGGGVLVPPDDVDALTETLGAMAADPARRVELGRSGAAGVREHYSADTMAQRALDIYTKVAGGARPTSAPSLRPASVTG